MALYQKYRPRTLDELVGQEFVRVSLQAALRNQQVAHAYLFFGSRGTGKTSSARILAKGLNCQQPLPSGDPCNLCEFCVAADNGSFVDLIEIDGASNRRIEDARALIEKIYFSPTLGKRKVYIIDEVHMLTKEAFNALLKTIEEPPEHAYFLLATTELAKVPETIRSRCQVFTFQRLTPEAIVKRLAEIASLEGITAEPEALAIIAKKAAGGLRDAIGLFEQTAAAGPVTSARVTGDLGISSSETLDAFYSALAEADAAQALDLIMRVSGEGMHLSDFLEQFLGLLREKMIAAALGGAADNEISEILRKVDIFDEARRRLRDAPIPTLPIEVAIVRCLLPVVSADLPTPDTPKTTVKPVVPPAAEPLPPVVPQPSPIIPDSPPATADVKSPPIADPSAVGSEPLPLNEQTLREEIGTIQATITDPVLKVALRQAKWKVASPQEIVITFPSQSYHQQSKEERRFRQLLDAARARFGDQLEITLEDVPVVLEPVEAVPSVSTEDAPIVDPAEVRKIFGIASS